MKEENNVKILDDLSKGCCMGKDAVEVILEKAEGKNFRKVLEDLYNEYDSICDKVNKIYSKYSENEPNETSTMNKAMTWYGIQMRTITDSSTTKLAEMILQGLNMGVIDGKKLLNHEVADKKVLDLVDEYVNMQEKFVEEVKEFL